MDECPFCIIVQEGDAVEGPLIEVAGLFLRLGFRRLPPGEISQFLPDGKSPQPRLDWMSLSCVHQFHLEAVSRNDGFSWIYLVDTNIRFFR